MVQWSKTFLFPPVCLHADLEESPERDSNRISWGRLIGRMRHGHIVVYMSSTTPVLFGGSQELVAMLDRATISQLFLTISTGDRPCEC